MNSLALQTTDLTEFMTLPEEVRREINNWQRELMAVTKPIQASLERVAERLGVSLQTARRKYDLWRKANDWRVLINRAKVPVSRGLPPELIEFWKKLCSENSRSNLAAYRELVRRFKRGDAIDGVPHGTKRITLPPGWSYDNLQRHAPTPFEKTAARIGRSAAADFRPKLFTTRKGLKVGQFYIFDDMWHDFEVVYVGQKKPLRLLQLHAHDLYSGCQFARGLKPRLRDDDGKSTGLKEAEMLFLVAHVLEVWGFYFDGVVLMVEHGTAAISEGLEKLLFDLSGGKVRVNRSGIEGASSFAGQYAGRGKGNFRFKASLESLGNLIHNETANVLEFPGQTGSNSRINLPEELAGREKHAIALEMALVALPPALRQQLRMPFLEVTQAKWAVTEVMERINRRTDHELEGWLECGHTAMDMLLPGIGVLPQADYLALPEEKRNALAAIATPSPRKLSPFEVHAAGRGELVKFTPVQCAALLATLEKKEVSVGKDHLIVFEDQTISSEPLRFLAHHFPKGEKFGAVINPMGPEGLHLFDARGGWVGTVDAWQPVSPLDTDGLHRQMGAAAKVERELLAPLARRGAQITQKRLADAEHNIEVLTGPEKRAAREAAAFDRKIVNKYGSPEVTPNDQDGTDDGSSFLSKLSAKEGV